MNTETAEIIGIIDDLNESLLADQGVRLTPAQIIELYTEISELIKE